MSDSSAENPSSRLAADLFRREGARLIGMLTRHLGMHRLQLAEDVVQETLVRALQTWPYRGIPENPAAWLTQTAKNLAWDLLRRERRWTEREVAVATEHERWLASGSGVEMEDALADDTLRLLFACFHPQLSVEAQTALALRTVCGLSPAEIASAFLTSEAAISKRLVRARQRIRELAIPFALPGPQDLPARLDGVLGVLYLLFNEGYKASGGDHLVRAELCHEAIRLVQLLTEHAVTRQPRCWALLALMCFNAARLDARHDEAGQLLRLHEQNRATWDRALIERGLRCLALAAQGDRASTYHLEAGIAACHAIAADEPSTDWARIVALYDQLLEINPSPVVALNRAVAVGRLRGAREGFRELTAIKDRAALESYYLYHMVRGTFAADLGASGEARRHFLRSYELAELPAERDFIQRRIAECG